MPSKSRKTDSQGKVPEVAPRDVVRPWLLAGLVAVCVARPLVPSEGVAWLGDGHPLTLILLLLSTAYMAMVGFRRAALRKFELTDYAVLGLVVACVGSAVIDVAISRYGAKGMEFGRRLPAPRLATNMIWEWIGLGLVYLLARQLVGNRAEMRGVVIVLIALAVAISGIGLYQVAITLPAQRAAYAENPDQILQELGQWLAQDSPERIRFESRLASTEPLATFALTNSLAGLLVTWLVVTLGVAWRTLRIPLAGWKRIATYAGLALGILVLGICFSLTHSRSAYVAFAVGIALLPLVARAAGKGVPRKWLAAVGGGVVLLVAVAFIARGDRLFADAEKSLEYRFEYWDSTLNMIADFPIFGVGPGEFQNYYTQYKLPEASEEISDPHNFVLETWATGGTLALLALVGFLAAFAWQSWEVEEPTEVQDDDTPAARDTVRLILLGAATGVGLAYAVGMPFGFFLSVQDIGLMLILGAATIATLWAWLWHGTFPVRLPALAVLVLAIHWLASGGLTFPGVAYSFWLLAALGVNQESVVLRPAESSVYGWRRFALPLMLALPMVALSWACYYTAFMPVMARRAILSAAADPGVPEETRTAMVMAAIEVDVLSAEPWIALAQISARQVEKDPKSAKWRERLLLATQGATALESHSSSTAREMGRILAKVYEASPNAEIGEEWVKYTRNATYHYPNSATLQAEYATALEKTGSHDTAVRVARRALELDELTPHADKKISKGLRTEMEKLTER